jgi:ADP-heptose:LPS heptosyltransferase
MFEHQVEAPIIALKELGIDCHEVVFEINVPVSDMEVVDTWWLHHGLNDYSQLCIAVSPFAKQKHKCWPIGSFKKLGKLLLSTFPGVRLVIVGGPEDEALGNLLVTVWGGESLNFAGKSSILQSAEIIRRCKLFIGNDSGPSHLAVAMGTPVVTIFSSFVYPELWRPWGRKSRIIRHSVPCEFCFTENGKCPKSTNLCMDGISVEEVLSVCLETLDDQVPADFLAVARNVQYASHI